MQHSDLKRLVASYKFTVVAENAICDDYVTEKLWRTLEAGSVPIVIGSPKIRVRKMLFIPIILLIFCCIVKFPKKCVIFENVSMLGILCTQIV